MYKVIHTWMELRKKYRQSLRDLKIDNGPFTISELAAVKSTMKQGKSAGPDGIPPEVLKNCNLDDIILEICNLALMANIKPDMWSPSNIIPVPISGDLSKPDNYRGTDMYHRKDVQNGIRGCNRLSPEREPKWL